MGPFTKSRVLRGGTTCAIVVYQPYLVKEKWAFPAAWRVKEIAHATARGAPLLLTLKRQPDQAALRIASYFILTPFRLQGRLGPV